MIQSECGVSRRLAWGPSGQAVSSVERGRALAHITHCTSCREFASDMERMAASMARLGDTVPVPADVQLRLKRGIAEVMRAEFPDTPTRPTAVTRSPRRLHHLRAAISASRRRVRRVVRGTPATARLALVAAALVLAFVSLRSDAPDAVTQVVDQQAQLLSEPGIESSDAVVVQRWLTVRVTNHVHVPVFEDARLVGAAVITLAGERVAVLRFQVGAAFVTYTLLPERPRGALPRGALTDTEWRTAVHGPRSSVSWSDADMQHIWVGELPIPYLLSLAKRCAEQARMSTAGMHPARTVEQYPHLLFGA